MSALVLTKTYAQPHFCEREILRYAGCKGEDAALTAMVRSCMEEVSGVLSYRVCYLHLPVTVTETCCNFGAFCWQSKALAANLSGCESAVLFAATVGVAMDRLIAKYGRLSPARALVLQALGAERIEALCDAFCADLAEEFSTGTAPRFSPGYGDLPLTAQKDLFAVLAPEQHIGLTLNDSLLMSPSKSVTAIVGLGKPCAEPPHTKCAHCEKLDCTYRGAI